MSPEGADLVLPTHIPHSEADVLVLHCLHVKPWKQEQHVKQTQGSIISVREVILLFCAPTNGWDCGDYFPKLELVEDGCFPRSIEPNHQDPHLLLSDEALQQIPKNVPHDSDPFFKLQSEATIVTLDNSLS